MDKIEQLYNLYLSKGIITSKTSLDTFRNADQGQIDALYNLGKKNGLFSTTGLDTFSGAWSVKKKEEPTSDSTSQNQELASGQQAEVGTSDTTQDERGQLVKDIDAGKYDQRIEELQSENDLKELEKQQRVDGLLEKYKSETTLSVNDFDEVNQTIKKEKGEDIGFFSMIGNALKSAISNPFSVNAPKPTAKKEDFAKAQEQVAEELGVEKSKVTPEQIQEKYWEVRKDNLVKTKKEKKTEEFIENLEEGEQKELNNHFSIKSGELKAKSYSNLIEIENTTKELEKADAEIEALGAQIKTIQDAYNPEEQYPEEYYKNNEELRQQYNALVENRNVLYGNLNNTIKDFSDTEEDILSTNEELDLFKRNYNKLDNFSAKIGIAGEDLLLNLSYLMNDLSSVNGFSLVPGGTLVPTESINQAIGEQKNLLEQEKNQYRKGKSVEDISSPEDLLEWGMDLTAEQTPNTLLMLTTGGMSLPLMGATTSGAKLYELNQEEKELGKEYSNIEKYGSVFITGVAEALSEKVSLGQLGAAKRTFLSIGQDKLKDGVSTYLRKNLPKYAIDVIEEGGTEVLSQLSENIADKYLLGKDKDLTEGLTESFLSGAFLSGVVYKAPGIAKGIVDIAIPKDVNQKIGENTNKIIDINQELTKDLDADVKTALESKRDALLSENDNLLDKSFKNIDKLSQEQKKELLDIEKSKYDIRKEAQKINESNVEESVKKTMLSDYSKQIEDLETRREQLLNPQDAQTQENTTQETQQELLPTQDEAVQEETVNSEDVNTTENETTQTEGTTTNGEVATQPNMEGQGIQPKTAKTEVKRINPQGVKGEFNVEFDENGSVTKITNTNGREISKWRYDKKTGKPIGRNANYSKIEAEATGGITVNQANEERKSKLEQAKTEFKPSTPYEWALKYFLDGGKVKLSEAKSQGQDAKSGKWAAGFNEDANLPTIERASEMAWAESDGTVDQREVLNEMENIVRGNTSLSELENKFMEDYDSTQEQQKAEEDRAMRGTLTEKEVELMEAVWQEDNYISELSDQEAIEYFEDKIKEYEQGQQATIEQQQREADDTGRTVDTGSVKTQKTEEQSKEVNLSESLKINDFISNLDQAIDKLDQFGKETLGMNLPVAVAKSALQAMKLASLTAKSVADIVSAGINAVKETKWYQNLSKKEQQDIEDNFLTYINKPFTNTPKEKSRFTIEEELDQFINQGLSESEILEQYEDRRDKMIAKDHLTRKKKASPEQAKKIVDGAFKNSEDQINSKSNQNAVSKAFRKFAQSVWDRQFLPKFLLMKSGGKLVRNYLLASKGASGYAKLMYDEAYDKIYRGLDNKKLEMLDKIIMLRRMIAIDNERAKQDKPLVVHQDYINKDTAQTYLDQLKEEIGEEAYKELDKRATQYFKEFKSLLDNMYEAGLVSKQTRDSFFDIDYQPREFLQFLKNAEDEIDMDKGRGIGSSKGLDSDQIKKLEDGLDTALIWDSQYLLSRAMNVRAQSIAMNNANTKLAEFMLEQKKKVDELKQKDPKKLTKKEKDTIKYFNELEKNVRLNPIIGFSDNGNPKYMISKTPNGFSNAYYYKNGVKHNILMTDKFHEQYYDQVKGIFKDNNVKEKAALLSGTALVKTIATGNNPVFFLSNTPRDFVYIATLSDVYGSNVVKNMLKLTKDAYKGVRDIRKESDRFKNFVKYGGMMDFLHRQGRFKGTNTIRKIIDSKIDNKTQDKISNVFSWATLQRMQMYSEIGFRMAVFNRSIKNQLRELGVETEQELRDKLGDEAQGKLNDIYTNAVASARSTTDFNQGGTVIKDADAFLPYLNASTQGVRVMFDSFRERPVETTFRVTQTAAILSSIGITGSIALLSAFRGDDEPEEDKDLTPIELYLKAKKGVSKYERNNYILIFTGKRTKDGEFEYFRIAKPQALTPFLSLTENIMVETMKKNVGDNTSSTLIDDIAFTLNNNVSPIEASITGNVTKNPIIKSALTYATGYDFFREQDLSYQRGKVPVAAEGYENPRVEEFYKELGDKYNMSPARMKGAIESLITTPSTSPYVGMFYGGLDALVSDKDGKQVVEKLGKDILKSSVNRVYKETSDYNRRLENNEKLKEKIDRIEVEDIKTKTEFKQTMNDYFDGTKTAKDVEDKIREIYELSPYDAQRMVNKAKEMIKYKDVNPFVIEMKYSNKKVRALMLVEMFGDDLENAYKTDPKLAKDLKMMNVIDEEVVSEYKKLIDETK